MSKLSVNIFSALGIIGSHIPLNLLATLSGQKLFSPFYHLVNDSEVSHVKHLYKIKSIAAFRKDLDFLLKHFVPIDLFELNDHVESGRMDKKYFFLSFDDGLSEIYHTIAPVLKEKGIPATFFLNPAFIDNKALFYRYKVSLIIDGLIHKRPSDSIRKEIQHLLKGADAPAALLKLRYHQQQTIDNIASVLGLDFNTYLRDKQPYASTVQIKSLLSDGFTVGAHSMDHPEYRFLSFEAQVAQTNDSVKAVTEAFDLPYKVFSFPFTDFGVTKAFFEKVLDPAKKEVDLSFGCAGMKKDCLPTHIQRFPMEGNDMPANQLIASEYICFLLKSVLQKHRIIRSA